MSSGCVEYYKGEYMQLKRRSIRLQNYDYRLNGYYFVTIATHEHEPLLGDVIYDHNGYALCALNNYGRIALDKLKLTIAKREYVELDEYVIMPNHVHLIITIQQSIINGFSDTDNIYHVKPKSLSAIIRSFKSGGTKMINELRNTPSEKVWQRNYYEHIIRNEQSLDQIRQYIRNNPIKWMRGERQDW